MPYCGHLRWRYAESALRRNSSNHSSCCIDAPEKRQAFNKESKQSLSDLCFDKKAIVTSQRIDRYRRMIGYVECNGKDASIEQIKGGMAWVYDKYVSNRGLYNLQNAAQSKRKGL